MAVNKKAMMAGTLGVGAVLGGAVYAANHRRPRVIGEEEEPSVPPTDPSVPDADAPAGRRPRRPLRRRSV